MLIPILLYLFVMLIIAYKVNQHKNNSANYLEEYFIGSRSLGGFVLAMTITASYIGASSFVGGPGVAYKLGLGWVFLACIQAPTVILTLGILGKKLAIVSRKIDGVTISDFIKARYESNILVILSSISMLIFFAAMIIAQFVGGARLLETVTGLPYTTGLTIFGIVVILYTSFGGFRAVAITDTIQGAMMMIATIFLLRGIIHNGGGLENIMKTIAITNPRALTPSSGGAISKSYMLSFWMLVGVALLGLPSTVIRCMAFKDSKSMHRAMVIGTFVLGFVMLGIHLIGALGSAIVPSLDIGDKIIPTLAMTALSPLWAGIFIGGALASIMSSVDSLLIMSSAAIIKDIYVGYINKKAGEVDIKKITTYTTMVTGIIIFLLSLNPPSLLVWLNLFALGGLEAAFFTTIVLGLYWKRANATGAMASMTIGVASYFFFTLKGIKILGMHQIVPVIGISIGVFLVGSLIGKGASQKSRNLFFE